MSRRVMRSAAILAISVLLFAGCLDSAAPGRVLEGTVTDAANGMPVYKARVECGRRTTTLYTTALFRLTGLRGGREVVKVTADGYEPYEASIDLRGRETKLDIALSGRYVPGLAGILVWAAWEADTLRIDIRLTDARGVTLTHFPALPFSGEARLAVNLGSEDNPRQGALLFAGPVPISYDPAATLDRLKGRIPRSRIAPTPAETRRGILTFTLKTPQGTFRWTRGDVPLDGGK